MPANLFRIRLSLAACFLALAVVGLGAFTRLSDAGLGCPDWPGCYGHLSWPKEQADIAAAEALFPHAPVDTDKTWPEMVHRYFAGTLGLVIVWLAVIAIKDKSQGGIKKLPWMLVILVIIQALFGMWTVTLKLWPQIVTAHLLGGFTTLSLLWLMYLRLRNRDKKPKVNNSFPVDLSLRTVAAIGLVAVIMQIAIGGWTSSNYAALACIDFPTCHGEWLPTMDFSQGFDLSQTVGPNYLGGIMDNEARTAIHFSHRVGALVVTFILSVLTVMLWRNRSDQLKRYSALLLVVLATQISLGITNIVAALPLTVAVIHNGVGALLLLTLITINYQLYCQNRLSLNKNKQEQ